MAEKELRDELNTLSGQGRLGSHDFGLDVQRLDHVGARVGDCIRDIESNCRWFDTGLLKREVEALRTTIMEVQTIVKQGKVPTSILYTSNYGLFPVLGLRFQWYTIKT